jgi:hypothetical protein
MPCIFCIAVFAMLTTAVTTAILDQLESRLAAEAATPVRRTGESGSVARLEFEFPVPPLPGAARGRAAQATAPVALTVYKQHRRVRIQVLTHDLERAQADALQQRIAEVAGLRIVESSNQRSEQKVREAFDAVSQAQPTTVDTPQQRPWPKR